MTSRCLLVYNISALSQLLLILNTNHVLSFCLCLLFSIYMYMPMSFYSRTIVWIDIYIALYKVIIMLLLPRSCIYTWIYTFSTMRDSIHVVCSCMHIWWEVSPSYVLHVLSAYMHTYLAILAYLHTIALAFFAYIEHYLLHTAYMLEIKVHLAYQDPPLRGPKVGDWQTCSSKVGNNCTW